MMSIALSLTAEKVRDQAELSLSVSSEGLFVLTGQRLIQVVGQQVYCSASQVIGVFFVFCTSWLNNTFKCY